MTMEEAKKVNFPNSYERAAEVLRWMYKGMYEVQHEKWGQWYRQRDGEIRWHHFSQHDWKFNDEPETEIHGPIQTDVGL